MTSSRQRTNCIRLPAGIAGEELVRVLDQYLADLEAGRAPSREKLLSEHPALASQLQPCLSGIEFIHGAARPATDAPSQFGDFQVVREVGRGGMGVVYEARQLSLKRKVALKVLRFAGVADRDAMERFQREAETIASNSATKVMSSTRRRAPNGGLLTRGTEPLDSGG